MKARKMPRDKAAEQLNEFKRTQRVSDEVVTASSLFLSLS